MSLLSYDVRKLLVFSKCKKSYHPAIHGDPRLGRKKIKRKSFSYHYTIASRSLVLVVDLVYFSNTYLRLCLSGTLY